eukprot:jgi/Mesvir1/29439/Mv26067-RA.1
MPRSPQMEQILARRRNVLPPRVAAAVAAGSRRSSPVPHTGAEALCALEREGGYRLPRHVLALHLCRIPPTRVYLDQLLPAQLRRHPQRTLERTQPPAPAQPAAPSASSLCKDDIRAVLEEHVTWPLAEKMTSLNTTLNTVEARVSNVETKVVHKLQPQFTALHTAAQASETHAALVSRLNQVEGKCGVLMKKLEAITAHTEALATQVPKLAEQTATIASQPPRQDAGDLPLSYADLLRTATASTTDAIATKLQELEDHRQAQQREVTDRARRECRVVLRRFPQKPGETSTSLADEIKKQLLTLMGLVGEVELRGCHRLPHSRDKAATPPVLLTFLSPEDKQRFLSRRKRLHDLTWTLDDDLTPAQQQQRRDLWPEYLRHKQDPQKPKVYWRGGDLMINHKMWTPPAG